MFQVVMSVNRRPLYKLHYTIILQYCTAICLILQYLHNCAFFSLYELMRQIGVEGRVQMWRRCDRYLGSGFSG